MSNCCLECQKELEEVKARLAKVIEWHDSGIEREAIYIRDAGYTQDFENYAKEKS